MKRKQKIIGAIVVVLAVALTILLLPTENEKRFKEIIKEYDDLNENRIRKYEDGNVLRCYDSEDGTGFIVASLGYEDIILIYAELSHEKVEHIEVLYHMETIGYGDLVDEDWFLQRLYLPFENRFTLVKNKKEKESEVIAITGATITSEAVVKAINDCAEIMEDMKK